MDTVTPKRRSEIMAAIRSSGTKPEIAVRKLLHSFGFRYRLYCPDLPGKPDLVFRARKKVIFVHGCFWHFHKACRDGHIPKSRVEYWKKKLDKNLKRDMRVKRALNRTGWSYLVIWQCQLNDIDKLSKRIITFLGEPRTRN